MTTESDPSSDAPTEPFTDELDVERLVDMSDSEFAEFIRQTGIKTVSDQ